MKFRRFPRQSAREQFEIIFRTDPNVYDGRWSNVGWLQELPKPVTSLSWDNAAILSGATLTKLNLEEDDIVEIASGGGTVKAPVIVAPGHPDNSVTVYLGYGREFAGRVGSGAGFNAYAGAHDGFPVLCDRLDQEGGRQVGHCDYQEPLPGSSLEETSAGMGSGTHSLEADEALGPRGIIRYATLDEFKAQPRILPTRAKDARRPTRTPRSSRTGVTTTIHGACRST